MRRRIPAAIRAAYPAHQEHITRSLGTSDRRAVKELARAESTRIDAEFRQKRQELELSRASLAAKRISKLDDEQLRAVAKFWVRQVLQNDKDRRQAGLDDAEFDALGDLRRRNRPDVQVGDLLENQAHRADGAARSGTAKTPFTCTSTSSPLSA